MTRPVSGLPVAAEITTDALAATEKRLRGKSPETATTTPCSYFR